MSSALAPSAVTGACDWSLKLKGLRVLAVEDEPIVLIALEDMLGDMGCSVVATAATVSDASEAVRAGQFDIAILDVSVGGELIDPVAIEILALNLPVIFATGHRPPELAERFGQACSVIEKPYTADAVARALIAGRGAACN